MTPRLAVRAVILRENRLLLVNAYPGDQSDLWCAPGGGVERGASLPDNLRREVFEETGLDITVGAPCLVNEFHSPTKGFHQVEVFFRCSVVDGTLPPGWRDPEAIVTRRHWFSQTEIAAIRLKPDSLPDIAWSNGFDYDALEHIVR